MTGRMRSMAGVLAAGIAAAVLTLSAPAQAALGGGGKGKLDTSPGCFGAGARGHTREHLQRAKALKILSVHQDVTSILILDNKRNVVFKGKPRVGQVIPLTGMRFAYLEAKTKGVNGCLVKYAPQ